MRISLRRFGSAECVVEQSELCCFGKVWRIGEQLNSTQLYCDILAAEQL